MLLISIIVLGIILLGVGATLLTGAGSDPYKKTCDTFIKGVINKETTRTYGMFSANARQAESAQSWSEKVVSLEYVYKGGKLTLDDKTDTQNVNDPEAAKAATKTYQLNYTLTSPAATSAIQCTVTQAGDKYVVDGFGTAEKQSSESEENQ